MKKNQIGVILLLEFIVLLVAFCLNLFITSNGPDEWYRMLYAYFDIPSLLCIVIFTLPTLFATGAAKDFGRAFLIGKKTYSIGQMKKSLEAVKLVQKLVMYSCLFTAGISFIVVLYSLDNLSGLGPSLAVICLSLVYASALEVLLLPLHLHVQNWLIEAMDIINEEEEG